MYCNKCRQANADDAVYCQKCGTLLEAEEETRVAERGYRPPRPSATTPIQGGELESLSTRPRSAATPPIQGGELEVKIFSVTPTLMFVKLGYALAVLGTFLLVAIFSLFLSPWIGIWPGVILGLALLLIPAFYHFRQKLRRYTLTETTIEIDSGLVSRTTQNIPLRRVQDVTVKSTIFQRLLGFGDVVIDNASEMGGEVILDNIDRPRERADQILKQMRLLDR